MENYVSLMIFLIVFMSFFLLVVYVADLLASRFVKWLGLEDINNECMSTPTIRFSQEDKALVEMVEGDLFKSV